MSRAAASRLASRRPRARCGDATPRHASATPGSVQIQHRSTRARRPRDAAARCWPRGGRQVGAQRAQTCRAAPLAARQSVPPGAERSLRARSTTRARSPPRAGDAAAADGASRDHAVGDARCHRGGARRVAAVAGLLARRRASAPTQRADAASRRAARGGAARREAGRRSPTVLARRRFAPPGPGRRPRARTGRPPRRVVSQCRSVAASRHVSRPREEACTWRDLTATVPPSHGRVGISRRARRQASQVGGDRRGPDAAHRPQPSRA